MVDPILLEDSRDRFQPCHPAALKQIGAMMVSPGGKRTSLDLDRLPEGGGYIDLPPNVRQPKAPVVGFKRIKLGNPQTAAQYWCIYPYNPGPTALHGVGRHEIDIELIQVLYSKHDLAFEDPEAVMVSNHTHALKREAWRVEGWKEGELRIYSALGSHARYFTKQDSLDDDADGKVRLDITWLPPEKWMEWPGKWGASDNSPASLPSRLVWNAPLQAHGRAKDA